MKKDNHSRFYLVKGWGIESYVTKVIEQIVMDFGLILHKTKVVTIVLL